MQAKAYFQHICFHSLWLNRGCLWLGSEIIKRLIGNGIQGSGTHRSYCNLLLSTKQSVSSKHKDNVVRPDWNWHFLKIENACITRNLKDFLKPRERSTPWASLPVTKQKMILEKRFGSKVLLFGKNYLIIWHSISYDEVRNWTNVSLVFFPKYFSCTFLGSIPGLSPTGSRFHNCRIYR